MEQGHFGGMVLLELQEAFDTADHGFLPMKFEALGLSQDILKQ